jgi:putative transposase
MTAAHDIDWPQLLAERLTTTHPDVLRELLATFIHTLMGAEADAVCGAAYGQRSAERTNQRNAYRHRQFDTRAGSLDLAIPKLRQGSYFPERHRNHPTSSNGVEVPRTEVSGLTPTSRRLQKQRRQ